MGSVRFQEGTVQGGVRPFNTTSDDRDMKLESAQAIRQQKQGLGAANQGIWEGVLCFGR